MRKIIILLVASLYSQFAVADVLKKQASIQINDSNVPGIQSYQLKISYLEVNPNQQKTILLIHGNSASKEFFEPLMNEKALQGFRMIAVDLPGHGESTNFPKEISQVLASEENQIFRLFQHYYTFPGYAHALNQFVMDLRIHPSDLQLFGWSLGGHIAIDMIGEMPLIAGAVLTGTPINTYERAAGGFKSLQDIKLSHPFPDGLSVFDLLGYRKAFSAVQARAFHKMGGMPESQLTERVGTRTDPEARYYMIKFAFEAGSQSAELQGYRDQESTVKMYAKKFLVVQGSEDMIKIRDESFKRVEEMGVPIHELNGLGHATFIDAPSRVAEFLVEKLR
jgi:pimeloyl-ACP methyl ester carboxylesterase